MTPMNISAQYYKALLAERDQAVCERDRYARELELTTGALGEQPGAHPGQLADRSTGQSPAVTRQRPVTAPARHLRAVQ